jgi:hypothetical protein
MALFPSQALSGHFPGERLFTVLSDRAQIAAKK